MRLQLKIEVTACYEQYVGHLLRRWGYFARVLLGWEGTFSRGCENSPSLSENDRVSDNLSPNLLGHHNDA